MSAPNDLVKHTPAPILTGLITVTVYTLTLAPDLTWINFSGDGGELITASVTLGVPHPPGYPTYVFLGKLFSLLPLGNTAVRFHCLSAIAAAAAAALIAATVQAHTTKPARVTAVSCGLLFAFTNLVWSQAIVAEVYSLNLLLVTAVLWALLTGKRPFFVGLLLGLSLTTHLTSLLLLPLVSTTLRHRWRALGVGLLLGLTPLLTLPLLARSGSPVVWGEPTILSGWWWLVSGRLYQPNLFSASTAQLWDRLSVWPASWLREDVWLLLLVAGSIWLSRQKPRLDIATGTLLGLVGTAVLYLLYAFTYQPADAIVLALPALALLSIGLAPVLSRLGRIAPLLPSFLLLLNFNARSLHNDPGIRPLAQPLLEAAPIDAVLYTDGDPAIFALWYFHNVEGLRPDLILVDKNLFAFSWYRQQLEQNPALIVPKQDEWLQFKQENAQERPFCHVLLEADKSQLTCGSETHEWSLKTAN